MVAASNQSQTESLECGFSIRKYTTTTKPDYRDPNCWNMVTSVLRMLSINNERNHRPNQQSSIPPVTDTDTTDINVESDRQITELYDTDTNVPETRSIQLGSDDDYTSSTTSLRLLRLLLLRSKRADRVSRHDRRGKRLGCQGPSFRKYSYYLATRY